MLSFLFFTFRPRTFRIADYRWRTARLSSIQSIQSIQSISSTTITHLRKGLPPVTRDHSNFRSVSNKRRRQAAIHKSGPPGPDNRLTEGKPVISAQGGAEEAKPQAMPPA